MGGEGEGRRRGLAQEGGEGWPRREQRVEGLPMKKIPAQGVMGTCKDLQDKTLFKSTQSLLSWKKLTDHKYTSPLRKAAGNTCPQEALKLWQMSDPPEGQVQASGVGGSGSRA